MRETLWKVPVTFRRGRLYIFRQQQPLLPETCSPYHPPTSLCCCAPGLDLNTLAALLQHRPSSAHYVYRCLTSPDPAWDFSTLSLPISPAPTLAICRKTYAQASWGTSLSYSSICQLEKLAQTCQCLTLLCPSACPCCILCAL